MRALRTLIGLLLVLVGLSTCDGQRDITLARAEPVERGPGLVAGRIATDPGHHAA